MSDSDDNEGAYTPIKHWGEILEKDPEDPDITSDINEDIRRSMQHNCLDHYPDDENVMQITELNLLAMDPLIMYAIKLHKWMNNMVEIIKLAELAMENNLIPADAKTPIPKMPEVPVKRKHNVLNFLPPRSPRNAVQPELDIPELSESVVKQILVKCAAVLTAHIGFEDSYQSVLDVLVDVLDQFMVKICGRFATAITEEENLNTGGFPNIIERVLVEMGLGGARSLHNYYQCRVIKYIGVLQKRCQELEKHYASLLIPRQKLPLQFGTHFVVQVKEEKDLGDDDVEMGNDDGLITSEYDLSNALNTEDMGHFSGGHNEMPF